MVFNDNKVNNFNFLVLERAYECIGRNDLALLLTDTYLRDFGESIGFLLYRSLFYDMFDNMDYEGINVGMIFYKHNKATTSFNFNQRQLSKHFAQKILFEMKSPQGEFFLGYPFILLSSLK